MADNSNISISEVREAMDSLYKRLGFLSLDMTLKEVVLRAREEMKLELEIEEEKIKRKILIISVCLSEEMKRCVDMVLAHGKLIRYKGGFWAEENAELSPLINGGRIECYYPKDYIGTNTIKALIKRGVLEPTKMGESKYGKYPVECALAKICT